MSDEISTPLPAAWDALGRDGEKEQASRSASPLPTVYPRVLPDTCIMSYDV